MGRILKDPSQRLRCFLISFWDEMTVDVEGRTGVPVSQPPCDRAHVDAGAQQPCRHVVPEIVEANAGDPRLLQPVFPVRELSQRRAFTSSRPANKSRKRAVLASAGESPLMSSVRFLRSESANSVGSQGWGDVMPARLVDAKQ